MNDGISLRSGIRKLGSAVITQGLILGISVVTGLIIPYRMGPEQFGYWQIYVFYFAYLNIFGLGFNDGVALYYGGYEYSSLPFGRIRSAMRILYIYLIVLTAALLLSSLLINNTVYHNVFEFLAFNVPLVCIQCVVLTVFLSVNRTAVYNTVSFLTKLIAAAFYLVLIFSGITNYLPMIYVDIASKIIITVVCIVLGRQFLFGKAEPLKVGYAELSEKSRSGINITLAMIASMFIPVAGRMIIEWNEPIEVYGMYSFAMTLLAMIIAFTSTAGTVVFPLLKRLPEEKLPGYYSVFSFVCDSLIYIGLILYIPLLFVIRYLMVKYLPVLGYMHILLVMCLPLGRMQLLITPYYKALRHEKAFFIANGIGLASMFLLTVLSYLVFNSVISVAVCSAIVLTLWTFFTERYLIKKTGCQSDRKTPFAELIMMAGFVLAGSFQSAWYFTAVYGILIIAYFILNRRQMIDIINRFKKNTI